ncbi:MAG: GDSL-type esterase/lipase family protein [Lactimicrobium sp.]|uniref:GDSL-type esterase/lipase family protein n=1 Tax=Lactimicrobium sp. TaxID=2563780 RepID=UPI002F3565DC
MKKKTGKDVFYAAAACLAAASLTSLAITGRTIGWGPFSFLHTWDQDVAEIQKSHPVKDHQHGIIFYGASNFRLWTQMEDDLSAYHVQNHGFGGCTDHDLVHYADKLLYPYHPDIIFFQTGSNDYVSLKGTDQEKVNACMDYKKKMFEDVHTKLPNTKLVIMSGLLLPGRSQYRKMTQDINRQLKELCENTEYLTFVDAEKMTWDGHSYHKKLFRKDGIHLNHTGELLWMKDYIQPQIEQLISTCHLDEVRRESAK